MIIWSLFKASNIWFIPCQVRTSEMQIYYLVVFAFDRLHFGSNPRHFEAALSRHDPPDPGDKQWHSFYFLWIIFSLWTKSILISLEKQPLSCCWQSRKTGLDRRRENEGGFWRRMKKVFLSDFWVLRWLKSAVPNILMLTHPKAVKETLYP